MEEEKRQKERERRGEQGIKKEVVELRERKREIDR